MNRDIAGQEVRIRPGLIGWHSQRATAGMTS